MEKHKFLVKDKSARLDIFLLQQGLSLSRAALQKLIKNKNVLVNGCPLKCSHLVKPGDMITVEIPEVNSNRILSENIPLDILYEDEDIMAINKPPGMVVHPAPGHYQGTLVNALLYYTRRLSFLNEGQPRPGIVHRLDRDTSGVLLIARTNAAHLDLARQMKERSIKKTYIALVYGRVEPKEGGILAPLGRHHRERKKMTVRYMDGREAISHYRVLEKQETMSLLEVTLSTGRTHQIRVHLAHIGYPVVGDKTYGRRRLDSFPRQALHAYKLGFVHPSKKEYVALTAPLPEDMKTLLQSEGFNSNIKL
jgi:23S rRNA pseudouridine1911/1915/1917 synthase